MWLKISSRQSKFLYKANAKQIVFIHQESQQNSELKFSHGLLQGLKNWWNKKTYFLQRGLTHDYTYTLKSIKEIGYVSFHIITQILITFQQKPLFIQENLQWIYNLLETLKNLQS